MPNQIITNENNSCFEPYLNRLLNYLHSCENDEPFTMRML